VPRTVKDVDPKQGEAKKLLGAERGEQERVSNGNGQFIGGSLGTRQHRRFVVGRAFPC